MAHIYDGNAAKRLVEQILKYYIPAFEKMEKGIVSLYGDTLKTI